MTRRLARFAVSADGAAIPAEMIGHAKVAFMDWVGVTYGGKDDPLVDRLIAYSRIMGGNEDATVLGRDMKTSMEHAALINGAASHALDYDDTLVSFLGHPSVTLFPALLALAEKEGKSGRAMLEAYLVGLQVGGTTGASAGLDHYLAGWHATSTLGHLAASAACAKLLGLNEQGMINAIGIGATQAGGLKRVFGTMCKPFHAGRAAMSGLMAALLAREGFTSAEDIIEGPQGFFEVLKGKVNEDILGFLGLGWDVVNLSQKYHASCHATHSPLEAARAAVAQAGITVDDIREIRVRSSEMALGAAYREDAKNGLEGKFCIPYCVANALLNEITGNQAFTDERVNDPAVQALMKKVVRIKDESLTGLEARVEVEAADGAVTEAFSDILQQIPDLEAKKERVGAKFIDLCEPVLGSETTRRKKAEIEALDTIADMADFTRGM
ncbi:MAG: MmgE/PrpD family protein [Desulfatibacillaceae bacterium]